MKKTVWKIVKRKTLILLLAVAMTAFVISTDSSATISPAKYSLGHITYNCGASDIGSYSNILSASATCWNNAISTYGCSNNISLTSVTSGNVMVSYTSQYNNASVLGRTCLYSTDYYGNPFQVNLTDATNWEYAYLYVYPGHILAAVNQSYEFGPNDVETCIKKTTVHEFGHILGLMHPEDMPAFSVMYQGLSIAYVPSTYDKSELHRQWCQQ